MYDMAANTKFELGPLSKKEKVVNGSARFSMDGKYIFFITDFGSDFRRLARMNAVIETDYDNRFIRVQTGRTNLSVTGAVEAEGFFYAPDPSSQLACAIGGNIAMNSGGAHCLKYGVTTNNLLGVKMVLVDGTVVDLGGKHLDAEGYDLLGLVCGSEGQLGVVTEAWLRILPKPEGARPVLTSRPIITASLGMNRSEARAPKRSMPCRSG